MGKKPGRKRQRVKGGNGANPFEQRETKRLKHEVFNRKVRGASRNVAKARSEGNERRKKTLLVEYKGNKKDNSMLDRRFGEGDTGLSVEDKMWARWKRDKVGGSRGKGGLFNLDDDDDGEELLTHKGKALGGGNYGELPAGGDEDDEGLDREVVERLHFGGGKSCEGQLSGRGIYGEQLGRGKKSKKEVLEEIIMKSKQYKLEKKRDKEAQEEANEKLDEGFGELVGLLQVKEKGEGKQEKERAREAGGSRKVDDYDMMMRELAFEARAKATDRTKTPEEIAKAERARLDELERDRLDRMKGTSTDKSQGRGRGKREGNDDEQLARGESGEAEDSNDSKHAIIFAPGCGPDDVVGAVQEQESEAGSGSEEESSEGSGDDSEEEDERETQLELNAASRKAAAEEMPYVMPCPGTMEEFLELLAEHASSAQDINTIVGRIHACHSVRLDSRNAERMHNLYALLLTRYKRLGDQAAANAQGMSRKEQLEYLHGVLYDMTQEMPSAAAGVWHRTLGAMQKRLAKALSDRAGNCWPSIGSFLQLQLLGDIFPVTDYSHPLVTPAFLLLGQCIAQCPVKSPQDLRAGLLCCGIMLSYCLPAQRFAPEALSFLTSVLALYIPCGKSTSYQQALVSAPGLRAAHLTLGWLREAALSDEGEHPPSLTLDLKSAEEDDDDADDTDDADERRAATATGALATTYRLLSHAVEGLKASEAAPEALMQLQAVLPEVLPKMLPTGLQELHVGLSEAVQGAVQDCLEARKPLCMQPKAVKSIKPLLPKFEESYNFRKDSHLDQDSAKFKQLKRQVKREKKGAIRELRRDAEFLDRQRFEDKQAARAARKKQLNKNAAWLQEQTATLRQQVSSKRNRSLIKGGGSFVKKRARVGRGY